MALNKTHYEVYLEIKNIRQKAMQLTRRIQSIKNRSQRVQSSISIHQQKQAQFVEKDKKWIRYQTRIQYYTAVLKRVIRAEEHVETEHRQLIHQMEELELTKGTYLSPISSQASEPITITVRMLSGDTVEVSADHAHPVAGFADQFMKQNGYHESATSRMIFLLGEDEKESIFWSAQDRHVGKSIGDLLGDQPPILHLFIRNADDSTKEEKIISLRKILHSLSRDDSITDDGLFDLYSNWLMTSSIPSTANRYQKMMTFVKENETQFPIIEKDNEADTRHADLIAFRAFRARYRLTSQKPINAYHQRTRDCLQFIFNRYGPNYIFRREQITRFLYCFTMDQLIEQGVTAQNFPPEWKYYRFIAHWDQYNQEADTM